MALPSTPIHPFLSLPLSVEKKTYNHALPRSILKDRMTQWVAQISRTHCVYNKFRQKKKKCFFQSLRHDIDVRSRKERKNSQKKIENKSNTSPN